MTDEQKNQYHILLALFHTLISAYFADNGELYSETISTIQSVITPEPEPEPGE